MWTYEVEMRVTPLALLRPNWVLYIASTQVEEGPLSFVLTAHVHRSLRDFIDLHTYIQPLGYALPTTYDQSLYRWPGLISSDLYVPGAAVTQAQVHTEHQLHAEEFCSALKARDPGILIEIKTALDGYYGPEYRDDSTV